MRIIRGNWLLAGMIPVLIGMLLFLPLDALAAAPQGELKQAIHFSLSADWFDPATAGLAGAPHFPLYLFHDALLKPMPGGTYTPCLAESYTISPDAKTFEFKLRKGAKFHNGDILTAEDVVFSFWRYKSVQAKFLHDKTEKVEAVNPNLVRFQFKEPIPDFLEYLLPGGTTIGWIVPKKYVEKVGDAGFKRQPVGAGPYKYVEFVPGVKLVAEAFEDYWRKTPSIKRMEFYTIADPATRLAMAKRGEVDIASLMQGVFYEDLRKDPKLKMIQSVSPTQWMVYIASQWDPKSPWADPRVRKAASLAIDRKTLAEIHMPGGRALGALGLEDDPALVPFDPDPYAPEQARKLLAEAGFPKGFHGGKFYPFQGGYWPYGEQVANYWKAVGITVDTILLDRPAWFANRSGGKMGGAIFIDTSAAPTIGGRLSYLFGPGSYGNDRDVQALWDQYQREVAPKARNELITRIQGLIHERAIFLPLTSSTSPAAVGPRVKGNPFKTQPIIWFTAPFEDVEIEK
jgi:peptide/nickel transport system substrate-binding protein